MPDFPLSSQRWDWARGQGCHGLKPQTGADLPEQFLRGLGKGGELDARLFSAFPDHVTLDQQALAFPFGIQLTFLTSLGKLWAFEAAAQDGEGDQGGARGGSGGEVRDAGTQLAKITGNLTALALPCQPGCRRWRCRKLGTQEAPAAPLSRSPAGTCPSLLLSTDEPRTSGRAVRRKARPNASGCPYLPRETSAPLFLPHLSRQPALRIPVACPASQCTTHTFCRHSYPPRARVHSRGCRYPELRHSYQPLPRPGATCPLAQTGTG